MLNANQLTRGNFALVGEYLLALCLRPGVQQRRRREVRGAMIVVRYADDIVAGFQHQDEADAFLTDVADRLSQFGLTLHSRKSRLIEFGRHAATRRKATGLGKPETFNFLGLTHMAAKTRNGCFVIRRRTIGKRLDRKLQEIKRELRRRLQDPVPETRRWLSQVLQGYYHYFAVPCNLDALNKYRYGIGRAWLRALRRLSQQARRHLTWEKFKVILNRWLPYPRVLHPWPNVRFHRRHLSQEPCAVILHPRISTGGAS